MYLTGFADEANPDINIQIKATKELGWKNIELRNTGFGGDLAKISDGDFEKVCAALEGSGVSINCFGSGITNWGKDIAAPFEETLNEVKISIPRMQKLGCKMVRIMSYAVRRDPQTWIALPDNEQMFEERAKRLNEIVPMFLDAGILPVHENCMTYGGMCWQNALKLVETVKGLKLVFDTGNPPFSADMGKGVYTKPLPLQSAWEFYSNVKDHVAYIHIKDARGETSHEVGSVFPSGHDFVWAGEGNGDVKKIVKDMLDNGYDGGISMEPHMGAVFHEEGTESEDDVRYRTYVDYGKRFMELLKEIGHGDKIR